MTQANPFKFLFEDACNMGGVCGCFEHKGVKRAAAALKKAKTFRVGDDINSAADAMNDAAARQIRTLSVSYFAC